MTAETPKMAVVPVDVLQGVILLAEVAHSMTNAPEVRKLAMKKIVAAREALANRDPQAGEADGWRPMATAPSGCVTENAGCRGASEWFLGRVAPAFADGNPPFIVIRRRAWPQEDSWSCAGDATYRPDFFDGWALLYASPQDDRMGGASCAPFITGKNVATDAILAALHSKPEAQP